MESTINILIGLLCIMYGIELYKLSNSFEAVGGALSGTKLAMLRFHYIIEKTNQNLTLVSSKTINDVFTIDQDILEKDNQDLQKTRWILF